MNQKKNMKQIEADIFELYTGEEQIFKAVAGHEQRIKKLEKRRRKKK